MPFSSKFKENSLSNIKKLDYTTHIQKFAISNIFKTTNRWGSESISYQQIQLKSRMILKKMFAVLKSNFSATLNTLKID